MARAREQGKEDRASRRSPRNKLLGLFHRLRPAGGREGQGNGAATRRAGFHRGWVPASFDACEEFSEKSGKWCVRKQAKGAFPLISGKQAPTRIWLHPGVTVNDIVTWDLPAGQSRMHERTGEMPKDGDTGVLTAPHWTPEKSVCAGFMSVMAA